MAPLELMRLRSHATFKYGACRAGTGLADSSRRRKDRQQSTIPFVVRQLFKGLQRDKDIMLKSASNCALASPLMQIEFGEPLHL
jgi:hypothetical protein